MPFVHTLAIADLPILRAMLGVGALFLFAIGLIVAGIAWLGNKRDR